MLFKNFLQTFLDASKTRKNSAGELKQKRMALINHLIPFFGDMELEAIGKPEIRAFIKLQSGHEYAEKTINNHLTILSRYLTVAREERVLSTDAFKIETIPLEWSETPFLSAADCQALMSAAIGDPNETVLGLIVLALNTGMRIGELLALDWSNVSLHARKLTVAKSLCRVSGKLKAPKNRKRRDIGLNTVAQAALKALPHREGRVFPISYGTAYDAMNRISERAGLDHVGWHTLRHTFASMLVMEGIPLFSVSKLLGHSSIRMTERYSHLHEENNKDAVACLVTAMRV